MVSVSVSAPPLFGSVIVTAGERLSGALVGRGLARDSTCDRRRNRAIAVDHAGGVVGRRRGECGTLIAERKDRGNRGVRHAIDRGERQTLQFATDLGCSSAQTVASVRAVQAGARQRAVASGERDRQHVGIGPAVVGVSNRDAREWLDGRFTACGLPRFGVRNHWCHRRVAVGHRRGAVDGWRSEGAAQIAERKGRGDRRVGHAVDRRERQTLQIRVICAAVPVRL